MTSPLRSLLLGAALAAAAIGATPAMAQTNVSINIGQPGFYGRIDMGDYNQRPLVYTQQPIIVREVRQVRSEPIYLRVPPGHRKHWSRHCARYDACGRPVMFVRDDWYTNTYAPQYRERHHGGYREVREVRYEDRRGYDDRRDYDDRGGKHGKHDKHDKHDKHGKGHGNGHGHGRDH